PRLPSDGGHRPAPAEIDEATRARDGAHRGIGLWIPERRIAVEVEGGELGDVRPFLAAQVRETARHVERVMRGRDAEYETVRIGMSGLCVTRLGVDHRHPGARVGADGGEN